MMVVGTGEGTLHFIHTQTGQEVKSLISSCDGISSCVFLKDGRLATTSFDGRIEVWDIENGCRTALIDGHTNTITGSDVTADKKHLATVSLDCMIKVWSSDKGTEVSSVLSRSPMNCVTFDPKGHLLAAGCWNGNVIMWNWLKNKKLTLNLWSGGLGRSVTAFKCDDWMQEPPLKKLKAVTSQPAALCVAVNGDYVAVGYHADGIKLFSLRSGEKLWASVDLDVSVPCMLWVILEAEQTDTDLLVSGGSDKCLRLWKRKQEEEGMMEVLEMVGMFGVQSGTIEALAQKGLQAGQCLREISWTSPLTSVCCLGQYVIASCAEGALHVWKWETNTEICHVSAHVTRIHHCSLLPNTDEGKKVKSEEMSVFTASDDGTVETLTASPPNWKGSATALCFCQNDDVLLAGYESGLLELWQNNSVVGHKQVLHDPITAVCSMPDNQIAVASVKLTTVWKLVWNKQHDTASLVKVATYKDSEPVVHLFYCTALFGVKYLMWHPRTVRATGTIKSTIGSMKLNFTA
ncbi:unnamed protein product [Oreochromis niloticus]|nr:unnamed protein product [Mustela putorius furo]